MIQHKEFKEGVLEGYVKFDIIDKERFYDLIHRPYIRKIELILTLLSPIIWLSVPIIAYIFSKWIFLFGLLGCFLGLVIHLKCNSAPKPINRIKNSVVAGIILIGVSFFTIYKFGFQDVYSIISLCLVSEFLVSNISVYLLIEIAIKNLLKNKEKYDYCIKNELINSYYYQ